MLLGLIIVIYQVKLTNFPLNNEFSVPNKRAGRNFSAKLIKCVARIFGTLESTSLTFDPIHTSILRVSLSMDIVFQPS